MRRPLLEWICAAIGAALVAATLVTVALQIPREDGAPPLLRVRATDVVAGEEGHLVRFTVTNASQATAAAVDIEGRLSEDGQVVETSRVTLDYAPRGSAARGGLWFTRDPACCSLSLRATGYQEP
ncbi:TIGR02588 family protein [Pseudoroseomonas ludipueritiae]|uniref:TIGR02588 family protein n=1 Tax=Pseudoroseomonas ludipueritiae TaxID=198093 RepID=A0ABR7R5V8_9PROT|nr:TIGR02588 family protein [Pseudoroseomonas ludipueritiae]MBC9177106.1 TIGR02588 family protein [Pseudoroseomonas ludipueritiae]